jgi:hypothetical protein
MSLPTGRDVATAMRAIEDNITGETGEDAPPLDRVAAVLLGIEFDGLDNVLIAEAKRVVDLQNDWYRRHGVKPTASNVAGIGIVQGITFAVAAQRLSQTSSELADRAAKWQYVIESLIGGLDDAGMLRWLNVHGPDLDAMVRDAEDLRGGMIAT